jgi:hypothetical protein
MFYVSPFTSHLRRVGLYVLAVSLLGVAITGCVRLLEPRQTDATYYLLSDTQSWDAPSSDTTGLTVGLRQPRMASYLSATRIVTRQGEHQIRFSEFHRWGEDLNQGINRTVARALAAQPGINSVEVVPWPKGVTFDYVVQLHVLNFEGVGPPPDPDADEDTPPPEGHTRMAVEWKILDMTGDTALARGRTRHQDDGWRVGNYDALVSSLGEGLATLADDLGARLDTLNRP